MSKVILFLADGTEECEALITVDLLRRAKIEVTTASVMGRREIISSHNIKIEADALAESLDYTTADGLVLPGGIPGTPNLKACPVVCEQVLQYHSAGKLIAAICAAPSIFAELGLLDGKTATVNPGFEHACPTARLTRGKAARDGNIITGQAVGGAFEFALEIVAYLQGAEAAATLRKNICY